MKFASKKLQERPTTGKCFRCSQAGYLSNECLQRKIIVYIDDGEDPLTKISEEDMEEDDYIELDDGDRMSCVLQRVCKVIINNERSDNFVFKKLMTILNLKVELIQMLKNWLGKKKVVKPK